MFLQHVVIHVQKALLHLGEHFHHLYHLVLPVQGFLVFALPLHKFVVDAEVVGHDGLRQLADGLHQEV